LPQIDPPFTSHITVTLNVPLCRGARQRARTRALEPGARFGEVAVLLSRAGLPQRSIAMRAHGIVVRLCSDAASYINGADLFENGGRAAV